MSESYPPHPGEFISAAYLIPAGLGERDLAARLGVALPTVSRILAGVSDLTPDLAQRLSRALGRSPDNWLAMQNNHALWRAKRRVRLGANSGAWRH